MWHVSIGIEMVGKQPFFDLQVTLGNSGNDYVLRLLRTMRHTIWESILEQRRHSGAWLSSL